MGSRLLLTDLSALWFLLIIPAIILLYMVRSRYRRRRVSSTMLWRSLRRDLESRQKLRLPPVSLLMLLQLLAITLGTLALVKPALPAENRTHLVVLVDVSAGMEATDVAPSRFAVAVREAHQAIQQMRPGDQISLVAMGSSPVLVASGSDKTAALAALDHLKPGAATADATDALKLAESLIRDTGGQGRLLLLSDGSFGPSFTAPSLGVPVQFDPIGSSADNQGITSLEVRPNPDGSGRWSAFARVTNYANHAVDLKATATADGLLLDTRQLNLGPYSNSELAFALPPGTRAFALTLDAHDIFAADNQAEVQIEGTKARNVLLVATDPGPIQKVLQSLPDLKLSAIKPQDYTGPNGADVVILDGFVPKTLPDADLLIMNPPAGAPGFVTSPSSTEASVLRSTRGDPLVRSVDLQSLRFGQNVRLETPDWARAVAEGPAGPLILEGDRAGRRIVIFNFDWFLYDLPRMQAFPLLLSNAMTQLNPTALPGAIHPGDSILIRPVGDSTGATVLLPDGTHRELPLKAGSQNFGETQQVGRYTVTWKGPRLGEISSSFDVDISSESASNVAPTQLSFNQSGLTSGPTAPVPGLQLWPYFAMALLGLLTAEWAYFSRRG